jgi:hypothetical protein
MVDIQLIATLILVAVAAGYLLRQIWRTLRGRKSGCGGGCSCAAKPADTNQKSLISAAELLRRFKQPS